MNPEPNNQLYRVHSILNAFYIGQSEVTYSDDDTGEIMMYSLSTLYVHELKFLREVLREITSEM